MYPSEMREMRYQIKGKFIYWYVLGTYYISNPVCRYVQVCQKVGSYLMVSQKHTYIIVTFSMCRHGG